ILAPSASAARVLAANGVDPAKLAVDENGMPAGAPAAAAVADPTPSQTVRFLFTGGNNPMKGAQVLFDACRRMASLPGWRLSAYGWVGPARSDQVAAPAAGDGVPVDMRPPFDPADLEAVYAGTDVVVVPSLMRESYSLVTREALTRGIPVVCTDTLGPEEVVDHGRNGLVVPAGDAQALAAALRSLVSDPGLLDRLRAGCQPPLPVRSLADQVEGLERMFAELVAGGAPAAAPAVPIRRRAVQRVLFMVGIEGAPLRYRARLPAEALALLGIDSDVRHYRHPDVPRLAAQADAVVVYRVPATVEVLAVIESVRDRGVPVVFDVDDLIFDPDVASEIPALEILPREEAALWLEGVRRYRTTMEACDAFVGTTAALCRHATEVTGLPAFRFPNGVGVLLGVASDEALRRGRQPGPPRVGYVSGTNTHDLDWAHVEPAIVEILTRHPGVELWLAGLVSPSSALDPFARRVVRIPFLPWRELPRLLRQIDVNLAPLAPGSRFNQSKSAIKWLEAALVETATVASPTEPFMEAITPEVTGLLASGPQEWTEAVDRLLDDDALRQSIGRHARREALLRWSPHLQAHRYREILETVERRDRSTSASTWVPVAHTEPPHPFELDPYGDQAPAAGTNGSTAAAAGRAPGALSEVGRLLAALRESVRTDGARSTAIRLGRYSARAVRRRLSNR
ncbi:MAG TPA: glycosyltransferase, partial [Acidimicrobiales bacterium]